MARMSTDWWSSLWSDPTRWILGVLLVSLCVMRLGVSAALSAEPQFRSGFGLETRVGLVQGTKRFLLGRDSLSRGDWSKLGQEGSPIPPLAGRVYINTGDDDLSHAGAEIVTTAPADPANPALRLFVSDDDPASPWVTRASARFDYRYGTPSQPDFAFQGCRMRFRMYLEPAYVNHPFKIYHADALVDRMREAGTVCQAWYDDFEYSDGLP